MSNLISWNSLFTLFNLNIVTEFASDCSNLCFNQHFISGKYASLKHILKIREKPQIMEGHRSLVNSVMMYSSQESQRNFPKLNMKSTSKYMILKWPPKQNFNLKILSSCEKKSWNILTSNIISDFLRKYLDVISWLHVWSCVWRV